MSRLLPLSVGCQYAIRTVALLSLKPPGAVVSRRELSKGARVTSAFISKILQTLTRAGLLRSHRGAQRGYSLARRPERITLLDVVEAYDGPLGHEACIIDSYRLCAGDILCAFHNQRMRIQKELARELAALKIPEVAKVLKKRYWKNL
jgi:Rrf2 family protein